MTSFVILTYISPMLYLDYAASAPLCPEALEALENSLRQDFANPSAAHKLGKGLNKKIEQCRSYFLQSLGAKKDDQFIFTSSATESNNLLIRGLKGFKKVFFCLGDHPSLVMPIRELENQGVEIDSIPLLKGGSIDLDSFLEKLGSDPCFVALSHVNNQSGNFHPLEKIGPLLKSKNSKVHLHVDGVQGYSKLPLDIKKAKIDSYSLSSHKIEGPKGIAGLFLSQNIKITPLLFGGGQENGMRSSTQAAPLIFSFEAAARRNWKLSSESYQKVENLNKYLRDELLKLDFNMIFPFSMNETSPYILTFLIPGISSDIILRHLEQKEIYLSSSSACSSKIKGTNPSFSALGIEEKFHKNVLRVSLASCLESKDLQNFVEELKATLNDLKVYMRK